MFLPGVYARFYTREKIPFTVEFTRLGLGNLLLPELREHARVTDNSQDTILRRFGDAAGERLERDTRRTLLTTTIKQHFDVWPWDYISCLRLSVAPVASITSIKYYDTDDNQQTWGSANYDTDLLNEPARVIVADAATTVSPAIDSRLNAVTIEYVAGYGSTLADLPSSAVVAMCRYATALYDQRDLNTAADAVWNAAIRDLIWRAD